jgi:hypothetical protein
MIQEMKAFAEKSGEASASKKGIPALKGEGSGTVSTSEMAAYLRNKNAKKNKE